jgi:tetratricopeptide (TPR) repeat protein
LLDFIDYLLEWSAEFPIFVVTLGRPELQARRPAWDWVRLAPLAPDAIARMLEGLAPGLPDELVAEIGRRAEGIPLYAVETIRMLQDRGLLVQEGSRYRVIGEVSDLEVPETLHALVASRLDGLSAPERSLLQDASVLGHSFTPGAVAALSGMPEAAVIDTLDGLVVKQILERDDDVRSPERGQYSFLQALLRTVAYGMLSRRVRKERHVAAARHLEQSWPGELRDIAEVLASHYQEAIRAEPKADDVPALRASARERLTAAGQAAASLALGPEAERYFEQAAELAENDLERADLLERAGRALWVSGDVAAAETRLVRANELYRAAGRRSGGAAAVTLSFLLRNLGRVDEARALLEAFREPDEDTDEVVRASGLAELAAVDIFSGRLEQAGPLLEEALLTLELQQAWPALAGALITRAVYLIFLNRAQEGEGALRHALLLGEKYDLPTVLLRTRYNLAAVALASDRFSDALDEVERGLAVARERGDRSHERRLLVQALVPLYVLGRWDQAASSGSSLIGNAVDADAVFAASVLATIAAARGDTGLMDRCRTIAEALRDSGYSEQRVSAELVFARDAVQNGRAEEAVSLMQRIVDQSGLGSESLEEAYLVSLEAAIALGDEDALAWLSDHVAGLPPARATPLLRAGHARIEAERAHRRGDDLGAESQENEAIRLLRTVGARPQLAGTLLERARRRSSPEALAEARDIYLELGAREWLERLAAGSRIAA